MKWYGKATEVADMLVDSFERGAVPDAIANVFLKGSGLHCEGYSAMNRLLVALHGYSDARGFHQWKEVGRSVRKGEKAMHVLAPCTRSVEVSDDDGSTRKAVIPTGFRTVAVFGLEQTDVFDAEAWEANRPDPQSAREALRELPLRAVAESWGLSVSSFAGRPNNALGWYRPGCGIALGVENLATWAHELIHAADDRVGNLKGYATKEGKRDAELVAELGGCALLTMLGFEHQADVGGAWRYVRSWAGVDAAEYCRKVIDRTARAIGAILDQAEHIGCELPSLQVA